MFIILLYCNLIVPSGGKLWNAGSQRICQDGSVL